MSSCSDLRRCVTFSVRDDDVRTITSLANVNSGMFTCDSVYAEAVYLSGKSNRSSQQFNTAIPRQWILNLSLNL